MQRFATSPGTYPPSRALMWCPSTLSSGRTSWYEEEVERRLVEDAPKHSRSSPIPLLPPSPIHPSICSIAPLPPSYQPFAKPPPPAHPHL